MQTKTSEDLACQDNRKKWDGQKWGSIFRIFAFPNVFHTSALLTQILLLFPTATPKIKACEPAAYFKQKSNTKIDRTWPEGDSEIRSVNEKARRKSATFCRLKKYPASNPAFWEAAFASTFDARTAMSNAGILPNDDRTHPTNPCCR